MKENKLGRVTIPRSTRVESEWFEVLESLGYSHTEASAMHRVEVVSLEKAIQAQELALVKCYDEEIEPDEVDVKTWRDIKRVLCLDEDEELLSISVKMKIKKVPPEVVIKTYDVMCKNWVNNEFIADTLLASFDQEPTDEQLLRIIKQNPSKNEMWIRTNFRIKGTEE